MIRAIVSLSLAAGLLAGCGGGELSKEEYGTELRSTMGELEAAYGTAGQALDPQGTGGARSVGDIVAELRSAQIALRDAGNRIDGIEPPAELAREHDELVAGVRDMADAIDLLVEAQEQAEADPQRARRLMREFAGDESFDRVQAAASALEDAGVDAGL